MVMLIFAQSNYRLGWIAYYQINKDFITKSYCINKNRPKMHCDGKCYLAKKIKETDERDSKNQSEQEFKYKFEVLGFSPVPQIDRKSVV